MVEVLIVEDAQLQKALIQRFVRPKHTVVGVVESEKRAINFAVQYEPDIAIIDVNLSEGSGVAVADQIDSNDIDTKVIISTAVTNNELRDLAKQSSIDAYLVKPYSKEELLETIEQIC
jgi:DNA-binding response OmpR family regulator